VRRTVGGERDGNTSADPRLCGTGAGGAAASPRDSEAPPAFPSVTSERANPCSESTVLLTRAQVSDTVMC